MNFHVFTYNEQMILFYTVMVIFAMPSIFLLSYCFYSKKEKVSSRNTSSKFDWDQVLKWQTIALAVNALNKSGVLTISFNDEIYTVTLLGKIKAFDGLLTYSLCETNKRLDLALKMLDHANTIKLIELATKAGDPNDKS